MIIGEVIGWFHFTARAERRHTVGLAAVSKQTRAASDKVKISSTATIVVLPTTTPVDMQTPAAKLAQSAAVQETAAAVRAATAFQTAQQEEQQNGQKDDQARKDVEAQHDVSAAATEQSCGSPASTSETKITLQRLRKALYRASGGSFGSRCGGPSPTRRPMSSCQADCQAAQKQCGMDAAAFRVAPAA